MSDNIFPEETLPSPAPKRERAKDTSPMGRAKVASTQLRKLNEQCNQVSQFIDKLTVKHQGLCETRAEYVRALDGDVIGILKAGGEL